MSSNRGDRDDGTPRDASQLLARGADDDVRADRRIMAALDDFLIDDGARLDDRLRSDVATLLCGLVDAVEAELRQYAARQLAGRGFDALSTAMAGKAPIVHAGLDRAWLLEDRVLLRELLARAGERRLGEELAGMATERGDRASLLVRLTTHADGVVSAAAAATMVADARRRSSGEADLPMRSDLPAELHHRLVWRTAAVLRDRFGPMSDVGMVVLDRALTDAALRSLAAHDEGDRLEAAVMRLAAALGATGDELAGLLVESIDDRRLSLFTALLAHGFGSSYDAMREIILDPGSDRLWLVLRVVALGRTDIARIGLAICDADPRRDVEAFAERIDAIVAISPSEAAEALATARLHHDFRRAVIALAKGRAA